jgi:hypothetical protein
MGSAMVLGSVNLVGHHGPRSSQQSNDSGGLTVRRFIVCTAMALALLACVPVAYSLVASLSGWSTVSAGAATSGTVRVTDCPSPVQPCRGTFGYADPGGAAGAQPSGVSYSVQIANDLRRHRAGTLVAVSLDPAHRQAYLSGAVPMLIMAASVLSIAFVLAGVVIVARRIATGRPVAYAGPVAAAALAIGLATFLIAPLGDHGYPVPPPNAPAPAQPGGS